MIVDRFNGITIRNFPSNLTEDSIKNFLMKCGLPPDHDPTCININKGPKNTFTVVDKLTPDIVQNLYKAIHFHETQSKFFDAPLYCKPLRNLTPIKSKVTESKISDQIKCTIPGLPEAEMLRAKKKGKKFKVKCFGRKKRRRRMSSLTRGRELRKIQAVPFDIMRVGCSCIFNKDVYFEIPGGGRFYNYLCI